MLAPLLLAAAVLVTPALDGFGPAKVSPRPLEQRLELELNPAAPTWSGSLLTTLEVRGATRRLELRFDGPTVSRVELTDRAGRVRLRWGSPRAGALVLETERDLNTGRAALSVAFDGSWREVATAEMRAATGVVRDPGRRRAQVRQGAGVVFPAWAPDEAATRWTIMVHAPRSFVVRANGRRTGVDDTRDWRTWTFRTARALEADSLRVTVLPARVAR